MNDLSWLRLQLYQWGRMNRFRGLGFPSMSATEKARIGRGGGGFDGPHLPADLEVLDKVVARAAPQHKLIIIEHYTKDGTIREHAVRLGLPRMTYFRRKARAEEHIGIMLQLTGQGV